MAKIDNIYRFEQIYIKYKIYIEIYKNVLFDNIIVSEFFNNIFTFIEIFQFFVELFSQ